MPHLPVLLGELAREDLAAQRDSWGKKLPLKWSLKISPEKDNIQ